MRKANVYHYDSFTTIPHKGNPAGVVLNGDDFSEAEMQEIATKVGFNETSFLVSSNVADYRIRFFTPGHEMNLCGHGTMATIYALTTNHLLKNELPTTLTIETNAGILPIEVKRETDENVTITMKQAPAHFIPFDGDVKGLLSSIGLSTEDLDPRYPIVFGSTGIWTVIIPILNLDRFTIMKPNNAMFPSVLGSMPKASLHPICMETYNKEAHMHGRHFSSAYSGTIEDPVTGTASGVMGAYYAKYISGVKRDRHALIVEQGQEVAKDGRVLVNVVEQDSNYDVTITGTAVFVKEFVIEI